MTKQSDTNGHGPGPPSTQTTTSTTGGVGPPTMIITTSNNSNSSSTNNTNTTSCFPSREQRIQNQNSYSFDDDFIEEPSQGQGQVVGGSGSGPGSSGPFTHKSYNSAQDTIYLCNFRVSVDGDWLCLRQLDDVEVPMQRPPSYYETLPPSPEFIRFYGALFNILINIWPIKVNCM